MVLEKQILLFMNITHSDVKQCIAEFFRAEGFNLSGEQFLVMDTLWDEGVLTQQQIADITMRDKNSIVKLIDGLEARNLVRRVSNPKDRRQNLIEVTTYSQTVRKDMDERAYAAVSKITEGLSQQELETFVATLAKMEKNMNPGRDLADLARKYPLKKQKNGQAV